MEELAQMEMMGFENKFSQAHMSLGVQNDQVKQITRVSSGRVSSNNYSKPKLS